MDRNFIILFERHEWQTGFQYTSSIASLSNRITCKEQYIMDAEEIIPTAGNWPVDPQEDQPISADRLWVDGCFDFTHHGM